MESATFFPPRNQRRGPWKGDHRDLEMYPFFLLRKAGFQGSESGGDGFSSFPTPEMKVSKVFILSALKSISFPEFEGLECFWWEFLRLEVLSLRDFWRHSHNDMYQNIRNPTVDGSEFLLKQLICGWSHYLQGSFHPRWLNSPDFFHHQPGWADGFLSEL